MTDEEDTEEDVEVAVQQMKEWKAPMIDVIALEGIKQQLQDRTWKPYGNCKTKYGKWERYQQTGKKRLLYQFTRRK